MSRRSYGQPCALAAALDQVGDLWALLIVRELLLGPRRFTELAAGLPGVGSNTLTVRLKQLEAEGVLTRRWLPPPAASTVYELTPHGASLRPIILALARWGAPALARTPVEHPLRANWLGIALEAFHIPGSLAPMVAELDMPTGRLLVTVADGLLTVAEGELRGSGIRVRATETAMLSVLQRPEALAELVEAGEIVVDGDVERLGALLRSCPIPRG